MLESADAVTKKQEELKELELKQAELDKEKSQAMGKSQQLKDEMSKLSARLDGLLRTQSLNKMQLRNIKNQIKQKIEETQLNMTFNLKEVGLEDNQVEVLQSQILTDDFDLVSFASQIANYVVKKVDHLNSSDQLKSIGQIQETYSDQKQKLSALQKQEDEYNRNVQVVVESDEQQMKLNEAIVSLKKEIDLISSKLQQLQTEFKDVRTRRQDTFTGFFDKVSANVGAIYTQMTQKQGGAVGEATIQMLDRDQLDTEGNILFEFKPPNKQFDSDIHSRSGGEKTVAALALVFAMAQSKT